MSPPPDAPTPAQLGKNSPLRVLDLISRELPAAGVECLLVGGMAVNHYGYTRGTLDVDLMIAADDLGTVRDIMLRGGYTNFSIQAVVAFFNEPGTALRVDFLQVESVTMKKLMARACPILIHGIRLAVPSLADLIAMKLLAAHHGAAARGEKDLSDIAHLAIFNGLDPERDILPLCRHYASEQAYSALCLKIEQLKSA